MEPIEADGILPDMGMHMENHGLVLFGKLIECAQGNNDTITSTVDIHNAVGDRLLNENSTDPGNHVVLAISRQSHVWGTASEKAPEARRATPEECGVL
jgi:hypothetical protein